MITNSEIGASATIIYTSSGDNAINLLVFCNTDDSVDGLLTVYVVPNGEQPATKHIIIKKTKLNPLETLTFSTEKLILEDGDFISCISTLSSGIVSTVSSIAL